jgi:hypothetical protein
MPNAVAMISSTNPPGRVRNFSLGLFGASAPVGEVVTEGIRQGADGEPGTPG